MSATCPRGHASATTDYCDQCGARISPALASEPPEPAEMPPDSVSVVTSTSSLATPCPDCGAPRAGDDRYCEGCGYDFVEQTSSRNATDPAAATVSSWKALIGADREYFDRFSPEGVEFPNAAPQRTLALDRPELRIGRGRPSSDARPEIDLAGASEDPAVSRLHATLVRQDDGSYSIVDQGSSNGTTINDDPAPIAAHVPVPLSDGDRVHVGAWTTITLRYAAADDPSR